MATTSLNPNLTLIESALSKDDIMKINLYYKDGNIMIYPVRICT